MITVVRSIQNGLSRLLISQYFLPESDPTERFRDTLRNKGFSAACDPTARCDLRPLIIATSRAPRAPWPAAAARVLVRALGQQRIQRGADERGDHGEAGERYLVHDCSPAALFDPSG